MSIDLRPPDALAALQPDAVQAWLKAKGWCDQGSEGPNARALLKGRGGSEGEVLLPTRPTAPDYVRFMSRLIDEVARVEQMSRETVLNDLSYAGFDVLNIRVLEADDGVLDLDKALTIFREGRSALVAAGNSVAARVPRRNYSGRQAESVGALMERVLLGQTSRGSFVAPLLIPYAFDPGEEAQLPGQWFARRVVKRLQSALSSVESALGQGDTESVEAFDRGVRVGVSSNLCLALGRLVDEAGAIELSIRWASAQPEPTKPALRLSSPSAPVLKRAASRLAESDPPPSEPVIGFVSTLDDPVATVQSRAIISAEFGGRWKRVEVRFDEDRRSILADVYKKRLPVMITGELRRDGRKLVLDEIERLEPIELPEFFATEDDDS